MLLILAIGGLVGAAIPAVLFWRNLGVYRRLPQTCQPASASAGERPRNQMPAPGAEALRVAQDDREFSVSVLIPARNEADNIGAAVASVLANRDVALEVLVLDDHSDDDTATLARAAGARVISGERLPPGWNGKQFACAQLAAAARYEWLVFMDADVRLAPNALGRMLAFMQQSGAALGSGVPRQLTGSLLERLLIPLVHWVLLGFLPMRWMRASRKPSYGAGCGQLFISRRDAYERAGGHRRIRASRHDGIKLPRAFRTAGFHTDLFDATDLATCRMYHSATEVWQGLAKNATEGLGAPATIGPFTVLLLAGQVMPLVLLFGSAGTLAGWLSLVAVALAYLPRLVAARQFRQSWLGATLHPLGIVVLLAIQWWALVRAWAGRGSQWKGRPAVGAATAAVVVGLSVAISAATAGLTETMAAPIRLKDQFHHERTIEFPRERPLVLTIADRHGHEQIEAWVQPLHDQFGKVIDIEGVADVAGIPAPFQPMLRSMFRKQLAYPVLLDWGGEVVKRFDSRRRVANLYVIDRDGRVIGHVQGAADAAGLARVIAWIEQTLEAP